MLNAYRYPNKHTYTMRRLTATAACYVVKELYIGLHYNPAPFQQFRTFSKQ